MPELGQTGVWTQLLGRWQWEPFIVAIVVGAGLLYSAFWARQRVLAGATRVGWRHLVAWLAGLAAVAVALLSPLGTLDHELFWIHMVQHELFIFMAPPLFLFGVVPFLQVAGTRTLPAPMAWLVRVLGRPLVALACSTAILWLWHAPAAYELALASEPVHRLEHLSFLGAYLVYWRPLMRLGGTPPILRTGASRALYLLAGGTQSAVLGALLTFAGTPYYRHYVDTAGAWGFTPLADQQLGGAVMLFSGAAAYVAAAALTIPDA
ncbi:MAG: cytochrome c oxidase assembly protein [Chloroflexota bacterium]